MTFCGVSSLEELEWYHGNQSRHVTESILLHNGRDGSYLLRTSETNPGEYTLSVRSKDAVKHFRLQKGRSGALFKFGAFAFDSLGELLDHFDKQPVIGGETGSIIVLKYPYAKFIEEPPCYDTVKVHAAFGTPNRNSLDDDGLSQPPAVASKEGFLTKEGGIVKSWKLRWFVLCKNELKYFKTREETTPIRTLDLRECQGVDWDHHRLKNKENCFLIEFPERTYYFHATSYNEADEWVKILRWQVRHLQGKPDTIKLN
ncbi:dual adapter for phosphotyrosine and 3-phosphotyrosine and 3-phosphoinositide-like [Glandiceps talaboti]